MRKEKQRNGHKQSIPASYRTSWMITFADFCTLLLTFFVLLVSMSSLDQQSIRKALEKFGEKAGVLFFQRLELLSRSPMVVLKKIMEQLEGNQEFEIRRVEDIQDISEERLEQLISSGKLILYKSKDTDRGLTLIFNQEILFESGGDKLKPSAYPLLNAISLFLKQSKYMAFVDGHTDNIPPSQKGPYLSNEELSFARAKAVVDYLVTRGNVTPDKLAIGAYGDRMPLGDNSTPSGRALNRRVEVTLKPLKE